MLIIQAQIGLRVHRHCLLSNFKIHLKYLKAENELSRYRIQKQARNRNKFCSSDLNIYFKRCGREKKRQNYIVYLQFICSDAD